MAQVVAITRIEHGMGDKGVKVFNIGDTLGSEFKDDDIRSLIANGSAVEIGKGRKFTAEPVPGSLAAGDEDTRKRDELIAKSLMAVDEDTPASPGAETAAASPDANKGGDQTIGQTASEDSPEAKKAKAEAEAKAKAEAEAKAKAEAEAAAKAGNNQ